MKKKIAVFSYVLILNMFLHAEPTDSLLQFIHTSKSPEKIATALNQLGIIYALSGNYELAAKYYIGSAKVCEAIQDTVKLARRYSNIGSIYSSLEDYHKALEYWHKAAFLAGLTKDSSTAAKNWVNIAGYYETNHIIDSASFYTQKANEYFIRSNDTVFHLLCEENLASYANILGDKPKAMQILTSCITTLEQIQKKTQHFEKRMTICDILQRSYNWMAEMHIDMGQYDMALEYLQKALKINVDFPNKRETIDTYRHLYMVNRYKKNYKEALTYYELSLALKDSVKSEEHIEEIKELARKYENEKIEKENILLKYEVDIEKEKDKVNQIRLQRLTLALIFVGTGIVLLLVLIILLLNRNKIRSKYLKLLSKENKILEIDNHKLEIKRLLAQINPHLIFNSLTSLQNYILLKRSDESLVYLEKLSRYMRNIFVVSEKEQVELSFEVQLLRDYIYLENLRFEEEVMVDIRMEKNIKANEILIPPLIFQPFVENAFKHGFRKENVVKKLKVDFHIIDTNLMECSISNNCGIITTEEVDYIKSATDRPMGGIRTTVQRLTELNLYAHTSVFKVNKTYDPANNEYFIEIKLLIPYSKK
jgi:tetratricopeptide (TPR) repeat protein